MNFADLGLGPEILKAVEEAGYTTPTPIQEQAIPVVLMGRDVLGVAQTGTGKTAGFTLPMIEILAGSRAKARMPRSLILAPTRELAAQVAENFEKYGKYHRLTMARLIGGESFSDQEKLLDRGVDVLIATPGRLMDLFGRGRILLNDVKILVIDEADRMLDMGFIPDVERIVAMLPKIRQTLFFSATMAPEIKRLADAFLMNPKEISVARQSTTAALVSQYLVVCQEQDKREALRHLIRIEDVKNALIFCNRKRDVDILYRSLAKHGFDVVQLHGDMPQSSRTETLERFKTGAVRLMVCSDVAARGLDISDLSHVFNYDVPHHSEDYVHRIGRTGRAGKEGRAFTFAMPDEGKLWGAIAKLIGKDIERMPIEGLPELELDMDASPRRGGRGGSERAPRGGSASSSASAAPRPERGRRDRKDRPERVIEVAVASPAEIAPVADHIVERLAEPVRDLPQAVREQPQPREPHRPHDPQQQPQPHYETPREPARVTREPAREASRDNNNRRDRYRGRRDEHGIGEMNHPDEVIGFGAHVPDFILTEVILPLPAEKKARSQQDDADEDEDFQDEAEEINEPSPQEPEIKAEIESSVEVEAAVEAIAEIEAPAEIETPVDVETSVETPVETLVETPVETLVETPVETEVAAAAEPEAETPAEPQADAETVTKIDHDAPHSEG
jgi:superfamily II DNA/RNA helicase